MYNECGGDSRNREATHAVLVNLFSSPGGAALSMCVGAFNTHCTTHTDVFKLHSEHFTTMPKGRQLP